MIKYSRMIIHVFFGDYYHDLLEMHSFFICIQLIQMKHFVIFFGICYHDLLEIHCFFIGIQLIHLKHLLFYTLCVSFDMMTISFHFSLQGDACRIYLYVLLFYPFILWYTWNTLVVYLFKWDKIWNTWEKNVI